MPSLKASILTAYAMVILFFVFQSTFGELPFVEHFLVAYISPQLWRFLLWHQILVRSPTFCHSFWSLWKLSTALLCKINLADFELSLTKCLARSTRCPKSGDLSIGVRLLEY